MPFCPADGSTASACEIHGIHGFSWKHMKSVIFMEVFEFHVKAPESNHSCPRLKTTVKRMPFCMVRGPLGSFSCQNGGIHWIPHNLPKFHPFWWNVVKFGDFGGLGGGNGAFTRSSSNTKRILGLFRCISRPNRYFSLKLSLIHIWRCRRYAVCRSRWSPYH